MVGDRAAVPDDSQVGALLLALDGEVDLADHRAQEELSVAVGGGGGVEDRAQVSSGVSAPGDLLVGERLGLACADGGERPLGLADVL